MKLSLLPLLAALFALRSPSCKEKERVLVIYAAADTKGTVAPCGCTTDPLGGLGRAARLIRSEQHPFLLLHAGPLEKPLDEVSAPSRAEQRAKNGLLSKTFASLGVKGPGTYELGGLKIAVVNVRTAADLVRPSHCDLAIALFDTSPAEARRLLRGGPSFEFAIAGRDTALGDTTPIWVGKTPLFVPGSELQKVARLEIHLRPGERRLIYGGGPGEVAKVIDRQSALRAQLAEWEKDPQADPGFVAARREELQRLNREQGSTEQNRGLRPPKFGSWFSYELVPIRKRLPSDPEVETAMSALAQKQGDENRKRSCAEAPTPTIEPHYVGVAQCGEAGCHPQAVAFWKKTAHAHAWKTVEQDGRAFLLDCFSCHVTGAFESDKKGATPCKPEPLTDVQCEVCHGPGSLHVAAGGVEDSSSMRKKPADDFCKTRCHTPEHSDTFVLDAYLRDILGEGHGRKRRLSLGTGPTGHELRQAALRKAQEK